MNATAISFLRIPNIALSAEIGRAQIGRDDLGDDPFENLEKAAQRGERGHCEPGCPSLWCAGGALQKFAHRIKQEKAESEMNDAIVVIHTALKVQLQYPLALSRRGSARRWCERRERSGSRRRRD